LVLSGKIKAVQTSMPELLFELEHPANIKTNATAASKNFMVLSCIKIKLILL
jgi:uncharacterized HAD superfamily protein